MIIPQQEWEVIHNEDLTNRELQNRYILPIISLLGLCSFIGTYFAPNENIFSAIVNALIDISGAYISLYITSYLIKKINDKYHPGTSVKEARKLCFYSSIPAFLGLAISKLHYALLIFALIGLYSVFIFWFGCDKLINTPEEKKVGVGVIFGLLLMIMFYLVKLLFVPVILLTYN